MEDFWVVEAYNAAGNRTQNLKVFLTFELK